MSTPIIIPQTFVAPLSLPLNRDCRTVLSARRPRAVHAERRTIATGSLAADVIVKAVEVMLATAATQSMRGKPSSRKTVPKMADVAQADLTPQIMAGMDRVREMISVGGPSAKWTKLAICVAVDLVGSGGLGVPLLADALDLITAPASALIVQALFASPLVTTATFVEEILPGTDGIPSATLAWLAENSGYLSVPSAGETDD